MSRSKSPPRRTERRRAGKERRPFIPGLSAELRALVQRGRRNAAPFTERVHKLTAMDLMIKTKAASVDDLLKLKHAGRISPENLTRLALLQPEVILLKEELGRQTYALVQEIRGKRASLGNPGMKGWEATSETESLDEALNRLEKLKKEYHLI